MSPFRELISGSNFDDPSLVAGESRKNARQAKSTTKDNNENGRDEKKGSDLDCKEVQT